MAEKSQRGANLSREDRERGGRASAAKQVRDARGQFAGTKGGTPKSRGRNDDQQPAPPQQQQPSPTADEETEGGI